MNVSAMPTVVVLSFLGGCSANLRPPDFTPIEYLVLRAPTSENVAVAALKEAAIRQATAACKQNHQAFKLVDGDVAGSPNTTFNEQELKVRELKDLDARGYSSATIAFRCVSGPSPT